MTKNHKSMLIQLGRDVAFRIFIICLSLTLLGCGNTLPKKSSQNSSKILENNSQTLYYGPIFKSRGITYQFIRNAQLTKKEQSNMYLLAQKGKFFFYLDNFFLEDDSSDCGYCKVVINQKNKNFGFISGEIVLHEISFEDSQKFATDVEQILYRYYPSLALAVIKVELKDILKISNRLAELHPNTSISVIENISTN